MKEALLHERAGESTLTGLDLVPVDPSFGDGPRSTRETQESPRRSAGQEVTVEELRVLVEGHLRPGGDWDLDGERGQWEKLAHVRSLARFGPASLAPGVRMETTEEERCRPKH